MTAISPSKVAIVGADDAVSSAVASRFGTVVLDIRAPLGGGLDAVVVIAGAGVRPLPLTDIDAGAWGRLAQEPLWRTITAFQQAWTSMRDRGGRIVLIVPTIGMAGAPQLVPYTTAFEGMRAMAKSAARQWADCGVVVNIVGVPLSLLSPDAADRAQHLTAPAVTTNHEGLLKDVVETVTYLLRRDVSHLVGQTITVDGGSVMLP